MRGGESGAARDGRRLLAPRRTPRDAIESAYEAHRSYVLAVLRRRCGWLAPDEREVAFHDAYAVLLEKQRAGELDPTQMHAREVRAYLTQTAIYKALDEGKRAGRKRSMPMTDEALAAPDDGRTPDEVVGGRFDDARIREILSELPKRRQMIVKLRFFFDRTPAEIQRYMGLTERAYRRELERAMRQLADGYELVRGDQFCDSRRSLILAYVAGIAGPNRSRQARAHLASCPGCNHWAAAMRDATERAAALAPLPMIAEAKAGALSRGLEALVGAKGHVLDAATSVKQHVVSIATRVDPGSAGYAAAARPGTVAAAVAGCLAVGSGATYCAVQGLPSPVRSLVTHEHRHAAHERASKPPHAKRAKAAVAQTPRPQTPVTATAPRVPQARPPVHASAPKTASKQRGQSAADQEFGPAPSAPTATDGGGSAQAASASKRSNSPSSRPSSSSAHVRPGPPGEFDP